MINHFKFSIKNIKLIILSGYHFLWLAMVGNFSTGLAAENPVSIVGSVIDEISHRPVANVNIYFEEITMGTTSDQNGKFSMENVPPESKMLLVKHIGYFEKRIPLKLAPGQIKRLNILLIPRSLKLEEIVFTASRHVETVFNSQMNIAVATREKISIRTSPNTADALLEIPGILVQKTTAGHGSPIIRGLIGKDVLLLYNGIRLNKPTFRFGANQYMNTIPVESLDRIEVTKGPGSAMYGSDAIGGVINMISESPPLNEMPDRGIFSVSARYGTADQSRILNATFTGHLGQIIFSNGLGVRKIGDLKAGTHIGAQSPTGYDEWNGNLRIGFPISVRTSVEFDLLTVQQNEVPRYDKYVTNEYQTFTYDPQNRYLLATTLKSQPVGLNWISSLKWNISYQLEAEGTVEQITNSTTITRNRNDLTTLGSYLQINSIWLNRHVLTYGYEIYRDKIKSSRTQEKNGQIESQRGDFPDGSNYRSLGVFINDNIVFSTNFDLTFGIRWSHLSLSSRLEAPFFRLFNDHYSDLTGTIGLCYQPARWMNLITRYASGFRAPNFNDTVVLKVSNAGVDAPSPGLSPEKSHNFEVGLKLNHEQLTGSLFVFYIRLVDLIDRYRGTYNGLDFYDENDNGIRDPKEVDIFQKRNVASAFIAGWEIDGKIQLTSKWNCSGFVFWTFGQNLSFDEPMSRIPPLMGMVSLQFRPTNKISSEIFARGATKQDRLSSRDKDDSRIPPGGTPDWSTLNFRCSWNILAGLKLSVIFENIFNRTYKEHGSGVYAPGRSLVAGLKYGLP